MAKELISQKGEVNNGFCHVVLAKWPPARIYVYTS